MPYSQFIKFVSVQENQENDTLAIIVPATPSPQSEILGGKTDYPLIAPNTQDHHELVRTLWYQSSKFDSGDRQEQVRSKRARAQV